MEQRVTMAMPRPGPGLKALLILIAGLGIIQAILVHYVQGGARLFTLLACTTEGVLKGELWRPFTAALLTQPNALGHLLFTLVMLYFLSPDLEKRWGTWRFLRFVTVSAVLGFMLSVGLDRAIPGGPPFFHPPLMFGAGAAITAIAIAWSKMNAQKQILLFFFLPVSGKSLFWITIGFCLLGFVYPDGVPEGLASPFGGVLAGILLGGTPSALRQAYLRIKLALLRRRVSLPDIEILPPSSKKPKPPPARRGGPLLRVVQGGAEEELRKRRPPKDKRYLN
jgi:membrane associated rhomboid family serine protease